MKKIILYKIAAAIILSTLSMYLSAQSLIKGSVKSGTDGIPMAGVTVIIKGTATGTITDASGNYFLGVASGVPVTLIATSVGYSPIERTLTPDPGDNWMNFWFNPPALPSDFDGNYYKTVTIGTQTWMAENLLVTHFLDGTNIPNITDNTEWSNLTSPGYCWYSNLPDSYKDVYGALYNGFAVKTNNLCPTGWHISTKIEIETLANVIGGVNVAGGVLKEAGTTHWNSPNVGATDAYQFAALGCGERYEYGVFDYLMDYGTWWTSTDYSNPALLWYWGIHHDYANIVLTDYSYKNTGAAIRCVQNRMPIINTVSASPINPTNAQSGGNLIDDGGILIEKGICWNTSGNPTISDIHTNQGSIPNNFVSSLSNLTPNTTYFVRAYVTNETGTSYGNEVSFKTPCPVIDITTVQTNVKCFGESTGMVTASPGGGTPPYVYSWNTIPVQTTATAVNLTAGTYTVNVIDGNGCPGSKAATITQPAAALTISTTKIDVSCFGTSTGSATATPSGGMGTYSYSWNTVPVQNTATASNLAEGTYSVTVTDTNGCIVTTSVNIAQPAVLDAIATVTTQTCNACNDAAINLAVSGGTLPYTFAWTGYDGYSSVNQNITLLKPGSYIVVVTDANGCSKKVYSEVINPFVVTNTGDANDIGTLRYAINYANTHYTSSPNLITFNIPFSLTSTIQPVSGLPEIIQPLVIDGYSQPGASFNVNELIQRIGLDGSNAGAGTNGLTINSSNCTIKGLIIYGFSGNGIQVKSGTGNTISANSISNNGALGIDLGTDGAVTMNDVGDGDGGANNKQNFPVLSSVSLSPGSVTVSGSLNGVPSATYILEFFASKVADNTGYGEGQTYLGFSQVSTSNSGNITFSVTLPTMTKYGDVITATATDASNNTSEFSEAIGGLQNQILTGSNIPFHYQVNGKGVKSIPSTAVVNEVISAFGNWSGIAASTMSFINDKTTTPPQYASASDKINLVTFTDDRYPFSPGILAVAAKTIKIGPNDTDAQIIDADIVFNPSFVNNKTYDFGIADNPLYPGFFDIQNVATHEIGHNLGLLHSGVYNSTMWFEIRPGTDARSLEQDDKSWLSYRYPNKDNYNKSFGSISGNIKYGYNNDPVAGAIVLAVDPATDYAVVHAYSDVNGNYLIPGLPPGTYRVYIMPLDGDVYGRDLRPRYISPYIYANTIYTDYPGEFYNNPDLAIETNPTPVNVLVSAGRETGGINFITNIDKTPPTVKTVVPADLATNISVLPDILITFSEPMDMNTITGESCYLTLAGSNSKIGGKYRANGFEGKSDIVLFTLPENALRYESGYTLHITAGVTDLNTNHLTEEYTSTFTTRSPDFEPPAIKATIPEDKSTGVFLAEKIMVFFSEPMIQTSVESSFVLSTDAGTMMVDCTPSWDGYSTFILTPKSPLIEGKTYTLAYTDVAKDLSGNGLAGGAISFSTIPVAAPTYTYLEPGSNLTTNVAVETSIVVDFSEPVDVNTINLSTFSLMLGSNQISGTFEFLNENSRVVFRPSADLIFGQTYIINLTGGISDVSQSKQYFAGVTKSFVTATKPSKPHIDYIDPPAGEIGSQIIIGGYGFDPNPANNIITFTALATSGVNANAISASLNSLTVKVPYGAISGAVRVTSNGVLDDQDPTNLSTYIYIISTTDPCNTVYGNVGTGSAPRDGAISFDGANAYITNSGDNTVSVITNLKTTDPVGNPPYEQQPRIQVGKTPMKIDINPAGTRAYVTNFDSRTVSVIDLTKGNNQVTETINVGVNPFGVVVSGDKVYVANSGSRNITVINVDPASGGFDHAVANINTGTSNRDIDITPDGGTLVVTGDNGLTIIKITQTALGYDYGVYNANSGTATRDVSVTTDAGTAIVTTIDGNIFFVDIAPGDNFGAAYGNINPSSPAGDGKTSFDGLFYYVTNPNNGTVTSYKITYGGSGSGSGTVSSSSGLTLKPYATIDVGNSPEGLAIDPGNDRLIVVNKGSNDITPVTICCPASKTASDLIKDLVFPITEMMNGTEIQRSLGIMLIGKLNDASNNILRGKPKTAINNLKAFIDKVNTLNSGGKFPPSKPFMASDLITVAKKIIDMLQNPVTAKFFNEESTISSHDRVMMDTTAQSRLGLIYPNPFSQSVTINYQIGYDNENLNKVLIKVWDMTGQPVTTLVDKIMQPGCYTSTWEGTYDDGSRAPYGTYFILFRSDNVEEVRKVVLIKPR